MRLVIGFGTTGRALCQLLHSEGIPYCVWDDRPLEQWSAGKRPFDHSWNGIQQCIVSPGIPSTHPLLQEARCRGIPIQGEMAFAVSRLAPAWSAGITGTNGKTTTTELATWMLSSQKYSVESLGNIGIPLSERVLHPSQATHRIVELSSYQLEDLDQPWLHAAAFLNLTPDHLDRYPSLEEYFLAKAQIIKSLYPGSSLLIHESLSSRMNALLSESLSSIKTVTFGSSSVDLFWEGCRLMFQGVEVASIPANFEALLHDRLNAAAAAWIAHEAGLSWQEAIAGWLSFQKGPHRCEKVACIQGVQYINDSKGTNLDAVVQAVLSYPPGQILIAGGRHKGSSYELWKDIATSHLRIVLTIGEAAPLIESDLKNSVPVERCDSLEQAVDRAHEIARPGETVLLSPGCSSLDQFQNYAHRGEVFRNCVLQLRALSANLLEETTHQ